MHCKGFRVFGLSLENQQLMLEEVSKNLSTEWCCFVMVRAEFGFLVEGSEFTNYDQRRKPDTRNWEWQIGKRVGNCEDDEEGEESQDNAGNRSKRNIAGICCNHQSPHIFLSDMFLVSCVDDQATP